MGRVTCYVLEGERVVVLEGERWAAWVWSSCGSVGVTVGSGFVFWLFARRR